MEEAGARASAARVGPTTRAMKSPFAIRGFARERRHVRWRLSSQSVRSRASQADAPGRAFAPDRKDVARQFGHLSEFEDVLNSAPRADRSDQFLCAGLVLPCRRSLR